MGWNLPLGCHEYDIPGNGPEEEAWEAFLEHLESMDNDPEEFTQDQLNQRFEEWKENLENRGD